MRPSTSHPLTRAAAVLAVGLAFACSAESPGADTTERPESPADTSRVFQGRVFERNVVFLTTREDSALVVSWLTSARTRPGGVDRHTRGLLGRSGAFETFFEAVWESPPTRVPWRILPRGSMRLVVGDEERLERIAFEEGTRQLHVALDDELVEWSGQRGETFRLVEGALVLSSQRVPGVVLDMSRGRRTRDERAGDWAVLASGDSLRVVLHSPVARSPGSPGAWRAWAWWNDGEEDGWPAVTMTWEAARAFERARREIPVGWSVSSAAGDLEGSLEVTGSHVEEGPGDGPQLPVDAVFTVAGTLRLGDGVYPVRGLVRHEQR